MDSGEKKNEIQFWKKIGTLCDLNFKVRLKCNKNLFLIKEENFQGNVLQNNKCTPWC